MKQSTLYHYGIISDDKTKILFKTSKKGKTLCLAIPRHTDQIITFEDAMAYILGSTHLMRVSGYKCGKHNKFHRYMFAPSVEIGGPGIWYGKDTKQQIIELAKQLIKRR